MEKSVLASSVVNGAQFVREQNRIMGANKMAKVNASTQNVRETVLEQARRWDAGLGLNTVKVVGFQFFSEQAVAAARAKYPEDNRIGAVTFQFPKDYAVVSQFNRAIGKPELYKLNGLNDAGLEVGADFTEVDLAAMRRGVIKSTNRLTVGSGLVTLFLRVSKAGLYNVKLSVNASKDGTKFYPVFRTSSTRITRTKDVTKVDEPLYMPSFNSSFNAAATALVQVLFNQFTQDNELNRGYGDCTSCAHHSALFMKDGVDDDLNTSKTNRQLFDNLDVTDLAQHGPMLPSIYCHVFHHFVDEDVVTEANKETAYQQELEADKNGVLQWVRNDSVKIGGRIVKKMNLRSIGTQNVCEGCPFYELNTPKTNGQINAEKLAGAAYVDTYIHENAKPGKQVVETLLVADGKETWTIGLPSQLKGRVEQVRVRAAGGLTLSFSEEVFNAVKENILTSEFRKEAFDEAQAKFGLRIKIFYNAAFRISALTNEELDAVILDAKNKPEGLTERQSQKWDKAYQFLISKIRAEIERQEKATIFDMPKHFSTTHGEIELDVNSVMGNLISRSDAKFKDINETGGMNPENFLSGTYRDLMPSEIVGRLDEEAAMFIFDTLATGQTYHVVGGDLVDLLLAQDAMNILYNIEASKLIHAFLDEANPVDAVLDSNFSDEIKNAVIKKVNG